MNPWHDIAEERVSKDKFIGYIEISKGSNCKYELDKETGLLVLDRVLYTSTHYPMSYGFIPRTLGDDGDPLDICVLCEEPIIEGCLVECFPIGVVNMLDGGEGDEKIVAIPLGDPVFNQFTDVCELPEHRLKELQHFFSVYKELEGKETVVKEVEGRDRAKDIIERAINAYTEKYVK